ncbi:phage shock envelope stress response protein PspM [Mycobacterium sp.]|uniref:phage shock envelope stress response protein PspM n=1 Tax=Mycobacterium sp. TaxID=1785 RepID=UPI002D681D61|nr:hypothetical protein [Mycobacterium sp.]HZA10468.1 hypothetical protein [Mycobacterium sp.]
MLQRGLDAASEFADLAAQTLNAAADPRARLLRKRRWSLRLGLFFVVATVFWVLVTAVMATWSIPAWALLIPGLIAAGAAAPATLFLLRWYWLHGEPLPSPRPRAARRMPPPGSAARGPMAALATAERGMFSLLGVIERANLLPREELRDLTDAANQVAATMAATAADVVSMEKTARLTPHSRSYLSPTIDAFAAQLHQGVRQYHEMVTAAAQLVSMSDSPMSRRQYRDQLVGATDRLLGWAQAFDELGRVGIPRR